MKVLVVEDDPTTRELVVQGLERKGFVVDAAPHASDGRRLALGGSHDVIVLDVMLPEEDGFALLDSIRRCGVRTPVLFLSARGEVRDRLRGFELGGDDYLSKPFAFAELVARLRAVAMRRRDTHAAEPLAIHDLVVDAAARRVERAGRALHLTPKEFALLECLARNRGLVMTRTMLVEKLWGHAFETRSNVIDVHIKMLRDKVDAGFGRRLIHTVRGVGYVLDPDRHHRDGEGVP